MPTNLRRVKRDEAGQNMSNVVWVQTMRPEEDAAVDIWAAQDTGVEDGGAPGQAAVMPLGTYRQRVPRESVVLSNGCSPSLLKRRPERI